MNTLQSHKTTFQYGEHAVTIETGQIARQATAAVLVNMSDTIVLVTVVGVKRADPNKDFFPMTVNYIEKTYAAGFIPGGYFKREGRPSEREILTSRLIDRPIRPLFPEKFTNEVQIVAMVMSLNPEVNPDIPALIGASAALSLSGMPFSGPLAAARVGYIDGQYHLNPSVSLLKQSSALDLVVAGTKDAILMVESEAKVLSEEIMLGAIMYAHQQMQPVIQAIADFAKAFGKPSWNWEPVVSDAALKERIATLVKAKLEQAYSIQEKQARYEAIDTIRDDMLSDLLSDDEEDLAVSYTESHLVHLFEELESEIVRGRILDNQPRIDGRDLTTIRPISIETGLLPRAHGSALFTRGETQAIVVATLGTGKDAIVSDALGGAENKDSFMLHYNFPPFCVGEVGMVGSPKRREIGHGNLAKRALMAVLP